MSFIHQAAREVHFKIVYAGPARGGKTTNLVSLHDRLPPERRGRLLSLAGAEERTLFFDFLALSIGEVAGLSTRFHLYTVPGQAWHRLSRRAVLRGADAIVFVADTTPGRERDVLSAWRELDEPGFAGTGTLAVARVLQWNKRDLAEALPLSAMRELLAPGPSTPEIEASALLGRGVHETLRLACRAALRRFTPVG